MKYILNPGPGLDVEIFTSKVAAEAAWDRAGVNARLYSFSKSWREYMGGEWGSAYPSGIPVKVIDAGLGR